MKRIYSNTSQKENVTFFKGVEVEHTPAYGLLTLFVVGIQDPQEVINKAEVNECRNIYLGANQSFKPILKDWDKWDKFITKVLTDTDLFVTLDFELRFLETVLDYGYTENKNFIPMISVRLPYVNQLGYNATLKIDDKGFDQTNPGVWTHQVHDLLDRNRFTPWRDYSSDMIIKENENE